MHVERLAVRRGGDCGVLAAGLHAQDKRYTVRGMVLRVDAASRTFMVSHEAIDGLMSAMVMPFEVRDAAELAPVAPGALIEFTLVIGAQAGYATGLRVLKYQTAEQDPLTARRLALLKKASGRAVAPIAAGRRFRTSRSPIRPASPSASRRSRPTRLWR